MRIHRRLHPIDIALDALVIHEHTGGPEVRNFHFVSLTQGTEGTEDTEKAFNSEAQRHGVLGLGSWKTPGQRQVEWWTSAAIQ